MDISYFLFYRCVVELQMSEIHSIEDLLFCSVAMVVSQQYYKN